MPSMASASRPASATRAPAFSASALRRRATVGVVRRGLALGRLSESGRNARGLVHDVVDLFVQRRQALDGLSVAIDQAPRSEISSRSASSSSWCPSRAVSWLRNSSTADFGFTLVFVL